MSRTIDVAARRSCASPGSRRAGLPGGPGLRAHGGSRRRRRWPTTPAGVRRSRPAAFIGRPAVASCGGRRGRSPTGSTRSGRRSTWSASGSPRSRSRAPRAARDVRLRGSLAQRQPARVRSSPTYVIAKLSGAEARPRRGVRRGGERDDRRHGPDRAHQGLADRVGDGARAARRAARGRQHTSRSCSSAAAARSSGCREPEPGGSPGPGRDDAVRRRPRHRARRRGAGGGAGAAGLGAGAVHGRRAPPRRRGHGAGGLARRRSARS